MATWLLLPLAGALVAWLIAAAVQRRRAGRAPAGPSGTAAHRRPAGGRTAVASGPVIAVSDLTRRFGRTVALSSVSLTIERGTVHGLVGANGAGKTTLIKHILGLLRAQSGSVRVFGLDPVADPVGVLSRIGYLSEDRDLPGWMRVHELLSYSRAFHPGWDDAYAHELRRLFMLDPSATIATLSRGQRARAGLIVALAHRPELLVLDEPSSGLDPVVRRDILDAVMHTIAHEGRTVLFSSHLLDEVERVADHVTMISGGTAVLSGRLEDIRDAHRVEGRIPSLDEIFVSQVGGADPP
jgi:ABC-2 type transport system ATP-binding protein